MSLHVFWAQILHIRKKILQEINGICLAYLWSGEYYSHKPGNVSWEKVCLPKLAGGLGVWDIVKWNQAALGWYVWEIDTKKDNMWIKLVHVVYIKEDEWGYYNPT